MNERIKELASHAWEYADSNSQDGDGRHGWLYRDKFAELIVEDTINILKQEWYNLNDAPEVEDETPRDIGLRVGAKSQTIRLMHLIEKHFEIKK